jgi:hypothetical protein
MNLTRVALAVALAWVVANLWLKRRRAEPIERDDGLAPFPSVGAGLPVRVRAMTVRAAPFGSDTGAARFAPRA